MHCTWPVSPALIAGVHEAYAGFVCHGMSCGVQLHMKDISSRDWHVHLRTLKHWQKACSAHVLCDVEMTASVMEAAVPSHTVKLEHFKSTCECCRTYTALGARLL
jgi:hypothetical protein